MYGSKLKIMEEVIVDKIKVKSNLVNPSWHPAPGAPCWVFIDEIMVE